MSEIPRSRSHPIEELLFHPHVRVEFPKTSECAASFPIKVNFDGVVTEANLWDAVGDGETIIDALTQFAVGFLVSRNICTFEGTTFEHYEKATAE